MPCTGLRNSHRREGDVVAVERQKNIVGVVGQRRRQKGEIAGDTRECADDAAFRGQNRVAATNASAC